MIALVDCNNFYASCERLFRPDLNEQPLVVLSNNDGCVIARSNEAKDLSIPMGAPVHEWETVLKKNNVAIFSSNYTLYGDLSRRIMNILARFAPELEVYSIDEAFLDLRGMDLNFEEFAKKIRETVLKSTGIPVSIGIAPTKTLAKVANRIAKKYPELNSIHCIDTESKHEKALKWLKIKHIWGMGKMHTKSLSDFGIKTAFNFCKQSDAFIRKHYTVLGLRTKKELEGTSCIPFEDMPPAKKAISTTRSFGTMLEDFDTIAEAVSEFAENCATKLRKQKRCAINMMLFIHTNGFREDLPQYKQNAVLQLPVGTNSSIELSTYARRLLKVIYKPGFKYKKAGIIITQLIPEDEVQMNLFDTLDRKKHVRLMKTIDLINQQNGKHSIFLSSQGTTRKWRLRQDMKSKHFTTRWEDLLDIYLSST